MYSEQILQTTKQYEVNASILNWSNDKHNLELLRIKSILALFL